MKEKKLYSLKEVSNRLKIDENKLRKWAKVFKVGKRIKKKIFFDEKGMEKIKMIKKLFKEGYSQKSIQNNLSKKIREKRKERKIKLSLRFLNTLYKELLEIKEILEN
ncbi:MAG: helix-turn-helix domain-containing protein [candidate division WOR-3 bacterium]|nr:helix-turn-helix domain-containing protein [candidate division WOR-3 bacterium]MCX7837582.1 helix-turn-helix domain-containing protein [candidate division WOR-3 bacterium]MDW8113481.1 MerR family transcriptional regulator [candidate division WOR-3 bacterium]